MRTSTAYFAGVGTVIVAVAAGLGGGYLAANIANPPSGVSKLERRMSAEPISVATAPAQPVPHAGTSCSSASPDSRGSRRRSQQSPTETRPSALQRPRKVREPQQCSRQQSAAQPARPNRNQREQAEKAAAPRDAFARARDADIKRADAEKRRAERRQLWAERRRVQQPREQELEAVEERVREVTEPRRIRIREEGGPREMFAEPARADTPRIRRNAANQGRLTSTPGHYSSRHRLSSRRAGKSRNRFFRIRR